MRAHRFGISVVCAGLLASGTLAGGTAGGEPVRVYTNADLEGLSPLPGQHATPAANDINLGWEFVTNFIEQHYGRLDADRAYDLERQRTEAEVGLVDRTRAGYGLARAPGYWGYGHGRGFGEPRGDRRLEAIELDYANRPVPLHAGATRGDLHRNDAYSRSGLDAIPQRSRPAAAGGPAPGRPVPTPHARPSVGPRGWVGHSAGTATLGGKRGGAGPRQR